MMSSRKFFIINVLNQLNACKICLELWTFIIFMTSIGGNFSALCMKSAKAGQTIYPCMTQNSVFVTSWSVAICLLTGRCSSDSVFEHFHLIALSWLLVYLYVFFFSFLFAALVANKVIIICDCGIQCSCRSVSDKEETVDDKLRAESRQYG